MRRCCGKNGRRLGLVMLSLGVIIILALIMPAGFWFFALGGALICAGIALLKRS